MDIIQFMKQSLLHPRLTGAVVPSSSFSAKKMIEPIDFSQANVIVELGAGTGVFTRELIKRKRKETTLFIIEVNKQFAKRLEEQYREDLSVIVIHDSAENVAKYIQLYKISNVDYVVSGLPFASLPKQMSMGILENIASILKEKGRFVTIQYTKRQFIFIASFFRYYQVERVYFNIPPAYIVTCEK